MCENKMMMTTLLHCDEDSEGINQEG